MEDDPPNQLAQRSLENGRTLLHDLGLKIQMLKRQATALGVFVADRELLSCPKCNLMEDVLFDGRLITYKGNVGTTEDSKLRFEEVEPGVFSCPSCHCIIRP